MAGVDFRLFLAILYSGFGKIAEPKIKTKRRCVKMLRGEILAEIAERLGVDLGKLAEAQNRSEALTQLVAAVERVAAAWKMGVVEIDEATLEAEAAIDENGENRDPVIGNIFVEIRRGKLFVEIDGEKFEFARQNASSPSGSPSPSGSGGNWVDIIPIAESYGVILSDSVKTRIAYYVGRVIRSIIRKNPNAKNDSRLRAIAERWLRESRAAQSQGFKSLSDFGF